VEVVRQRGGDCLSRALQQVTVSREEEAVNQFSVHYLPPIEQEEMRAAEEREQRAASRGREAARRLGQEEWVEEATRRTEEERRESVRLMEMLRTARILCNAAGKEKATETESEIIPPALPVPGRTHPEQSEKRQQQRHVIASRGPGRAAAPPTAVRNPPVRPTPLPRDNTGTDSGGATVTHHQRNSSECKTDPKQRAEEERKLSRLLGGLGRLDSTEEVSSLSTILEETEAVSQDKQSSSTRPAGSAGPPPSPPLCPASSCSPSSSASSSPFLVSRVEHVGEKVAELGAADLAGVRRLLDRARLQGQQLDQQARGAGRLSVQGPPVAQGNKAGKAFQLDSKFIQKVCDFSSSVSELSSDQSSYFRPVTKLQQKPLQPVKNLPPKLSRKKPKTILKSSKSSTLTATVAAPPMNPRLLGYIRQLLEMRPEEMQDWSVSSDGTGPGTATKPRSASLSISSLSDSTSYS